MKIKYLLQELRLLAKSINTPEGNIDTITIIKTNNFIILEAFGSTVQTDLIVSGLTASNGSSTEKISLQWESVKNVDGYKIIRNSTQLISDQQGTTYDDFIQSAGILTNYDIKTYIIKDGLVYDSAPNSIKGWKKLSTPILIGQGYKIGNPEIPVAVLTWENIEGATTYKIYKTQGSNTANFKLYGITTANSITDYQINFGSLYTYAIKASCKLGDSELSNIQNISVLPNVPPKPSIVTASAGEYSDKITINWAPTSNTIFYNIYRDTTSNRIATNITSTSFNDTLVPQDELHIYGVAGENSGGEGLITFSNSGWKKVSTPENFVASDEEFTDKIRLTWDNVSPVNSYNILKGNPLTVYQTGVTLNNFNDNSGITYGNIYNYGVQSVGTLGNSDIALDTGYLKQNVPETAPTGVSASDGSFTDKILITWNSVNSIQGISGYKIFKNGTILGTTTNTQFIDTPLPGICFDYIVGAFNKAGDGPVSSGNTGWINILPPTNFTASKRAAIQDINLNWSTSQGVNFYKIFRGTPTSLSYLDRTIGTETTYSDSGLPIGTTFAYAVKASCSLGDSDFSSIDIGETGLVISPSQPPTGVSASDGVFTDKVQITWNSVSGISGYVVFADGIEINETTNETINHVPLPGKLINYTVASKNIAGVGPQSIGNTGWMKLIPPNILIASTNFSDKIVIQWNSVSGATAYKIFTGSNLDQFLGITTNNSFVDFTPTFGQIYNYAIKSSCSLGDSDLSQSVNGLIAQLPPETAPTGVSASDGSFTDKILITWTPPTTIMGISGYNIYKKNSIGVETKQSTTATFLNDTFGLPGQTFEYTVSAQNKAGEGPRSISDVGSRDLPVPTQLTATKGTFTDKVRLDWISAGDGISYSIYKGNPLTQIATTPNTNYEDTTAATQPGIPIKYAVKAFTSLPIQSTFSNTDIGFIKLTTPQNVTASNGIFTDQVKITWDGFTGQQNYKIYKNTIFNLIGTTSSNSFGDTLASPGITYIYFVSSFLPNYSHESTPSLGATGWKKPQAPFNLIASKNDYNDKIKLSWNGVTGITTYKIYKAISFDPEIQSVLVGITDDTSFFDTTQIKNTTIKYAVKGAGIAGDSDYSNSDTGIYTSIVFYDGTTGIYPSKTAGKQGVVDYRSRSDISDSFGGVFMPFAQIADAYWLWYFDRLTLPGTTTGWTQLNGPTFSNRYGEGYNTGAFNFITKREILRLVESFTRQGLTKTSKEFVYINWTEDARDLGHWGFGVMTGPSDDVDYVDIGGVQRKHPRALIAEDGLTFTQKQNFEEICSTLGKMMLGGTGTDGVSFSGLKQYFPNIKFGVYNWPLWGYYFHDRKYDSIGIPQQELEKRIDFVADAFLNGLKENVDAFDMWMPSIYSVLNSPIYNKARSEQAVALCVAINKKLKERGKENKLIIPFTCPVYLTDHTGNAYNVGNQKYFYYIPPYTLMLNHEMLYEQIQPIITGGGHGAAIWWNTAYHADCTLGRITNGTSEDTSPYYTCNIWPFPQPAFPLSCSFPNNLGQNQWSQKSMFRQAVSAHLNYTKGVCLGITGNRWWWGTASQEYNNPSTAETFTPLEWLPLGMSLSPSPISGITGYGNKVAYSNNIANPGATTTNKAVINAVYEVFKDRTDGMIKTYNNFIDSKKYYGPNTQTWKLPTITSINNQNNDPEDYSSISLNHSPVIFYTFKDGTVGYIARDITRVFDLDCDLTPPENVGKCKQIVVGYQSVTALRTDGTLISWGKINGVNSGMVDHTAHFQKQLTAKGLTIKKIAAGAGHIVVLLNTGEVVVYGNNEAAQLSDPNTVWTFIGLIPRPTASDSKYITGFTGYASSEYLQDASSYLQTTSANSCISNPDPSLRYRTFRSLNPGCTLHATFPNGGYDTPYVLNGVTYPGPRFTSQGGFAWAGKINWRPITGAPYDYQFSRATTGETLSVNFSLDGGWTKASEHIPTNDSLTQGYSLAPNSVFGTAGITYLDISANRSNSMALTSKGTIHIWGWNFYYNVTGSGSQTENGASGWSRQGSGTPAGNNAGGGWESKSAYIPAKPRPFPPAPFGDNNYQTVKAIKTIPNSVKGIGMGYYTQYVIKNDGSLFAWDRNEWGESLPLKNSEGTSGLPTGTFKQVCGGYHHSIALRDNGTVVCWGENNDGECDVPLNLGNDVVWVGATSRASFALKADGTLVGWGGIQNFIGPRSVETYAYTEIPVIQNYSKYNIFSSTTIGHSFGCSTSFAAPNYTFPSWDLKISKQPGITFGKIVLNDFFSLEKIVTELPDKKTTNYPNFNLTC